MHLDRALTALYARDPAVKAVVAATGGGSSAAELLFRPGSSSTMLQFSIPYARASLQHFVRGSPPPTTTNGLAPSFCSREMAEYMARAAWSEALAVTREDDEAVDAHTVSKALQRFRTVMGVGCTAALATTYEKKGPHHCFLSICSTEVVFSTAATEYLRQRCQTYHVTLDKTLRRTRNGTISLTCLISDAATDMYLCRLLEEDRIVSQWLVYALANTAQVDPESCSALREEIMRQLHGPDDSILLLDEPHSVSLDESDPLALLAIAKNQLSSVFFAPVAQGGRLTTSVVQDFELQGLILPGSFNPLHKGHTELALAAQRFMKRTTGVESAVAFEIAVANADKGTITSSTIKERLGQFADQSSPLGRWPVIVSNATLFTQKAQLFRGCTFIIGADTAVRIVDKKYYDMDEHRMILTLHEMSQRDCRFLVAGRFDDKVSNRYISAREVLATSIPAVLKHMFLVLDESEFRNDLSSTQIRNQMNAVT